MTGPEDLMTLARVVGSVVVVLVLVALAARGARRAGVRGPGAGLRVLDRAGLSREASVAVVEVGGKALVLGVTAHQVTVLSELDAASVTTPAPGARPVPAQVPVRRNGVRVVTVQDPTPAGTPARPAQASGSVLSPATWRQGVDALRDLTARRGGS